MMYEQYVNLGRSTWWHIYMDQLRDVFSPAPSLMQFYHIDFYLYRPTKINAWKLNIIYLHLHDMSYYNKRMTIEYNCYDMLNPVWFILRRLQ